MKKKTLKSGLGLDIGQTSVKLLELEQSHGSVHIRDCRVLDIQSEGILDDEEMYGSIAAMVKDAKWNDTPLCLGLPQFMATTQVCDFAPGVKGEELDKMVHYETVQLAGLSEDTFLHGYQPMQPAYGRVNPVLLGISRELSVNEYCDKLKGAKVNLRDVAMAGLGVANTFYYLHPEQLEEQTPQLLMDVGCENSTVLIVAGGEVLYVGSMMFGSQNFTRVLANQMGCSQEEAEKVKRGMDPDWESATDPMVIASRQLDNELKSTMEQWRGGEKEELANEMVAKVWISGGGAALKGFTEHISRNYGCPVELLAPKWKEGPAPELCIAFGLALQAMGMSVYDLSLAPASVRWKIKKEDRFPCLVIAAALFFATTIAGMVYLRIWCKEQCERYDEKMIELNKCKNLIPELDEAQGKLAYYQRMLIPIVENGRRGGRMLEGMEELRRAMQPGEWCIYVGDEFSYKGHEVKKEEIKTEEPRRHARESRMFMPLEEASEKKNDSSETELKTVLVDEMPLLKALVVGGYTPRQQKTTRFAAVLNIQNTLKAGEVFSDQVDWLADTDKNGYELIVQEPWKRFLANNKATLGEFNDFWLKIPYKKTDVTLPVKSEQDKGGKRRGKGADKAEQDGKGKPSGV